MDKSNIFKILQMVIKTKELGERVRGESVEKKRREYSIDIIPFPLLSSPRRASPTDTPLLPSLLVGNRCITFNAELDFELLLQRSHNQSLEDSHDQWIPQVLRWFRWLGRRNSSNCVSLYVVTINWKEGLMSLKALVFLRRRAILRRLLLIKSTGSWLHKRLTISKRHLARFLHEDWLFLRRCAWCHRNCSS